MLVPAIVAGTIVVIGWLVVERFARRREQRADLREAAKFVRESIDDVVSTATHFYQLPGNAPEASSLAAAIRYRIAALPDLLAILEEAGVAIDTAAPLKLFRQTVTGDQFESQARQALNPDSAMFVRMTGAGQDLARAVQAGLLRHLVVRANAPATETAAAAQDTLTLGFARIRQL